MPYGIKNETPAITKKMESCVANLTKQGKSKESAIAICKSQITAKEITSSIQIQASEDNIPEEIHLIPKGEQDIRGYGKYNITEEAIDKAIQRFEAGERGKTLPIDEDHSQGKATGWINKLEKKANGLWGKVDWTPLGLKNLKDKTYKYFSSEFDIDTEGDGKTVNNILMKGGGQTNRPAFHQSVLTPVLASEKMKVDDPSNNIVLSKKDIINQDNNMSNDKKLEKNIMADEEVKKDVEEVDEDKKVVEEEAPKEEAKGDKKGEVKEEDKEEDKEEVKEEAKEEVKASETISAQEKRIQALEATIKASEVEKAVSSFIGTEKGNILAKAKDSVSFLCNEFHGNDEAMKHLKNVLANQVMEDVKGEIGSATIEASEKDDQEIGKFNSKAEKIAKEEGITYGQALKKI